MERTDNVDTPVGPVNREALRELRVGLDPRAVLALVQRLDALAEQIGPTGALRNDLFLLHVLAQTVLRQHAGKAESMGEPIWALAERLNTALNEWGDVLAQGGAVMDELARLAPVAQE